MSGQTPVNVEFTVLVELRRVKLKFVDLGRCKFSYNFGQLLVKDKFAEVVYCCHRQVLANSIKLSVIELEDYVVIHI
jgi:hypothetical protein